METPTLSDVRDVVRITELVEDVDALEPVCQYGPEEAECGVVAAWFAKTTCGHDYYFCETHKAEHDRRASAPGVLIICAKCTMRVGMHVSISVEWVKL